MGLELVPVAWKATALPTKQTLIIEIQRFQNNINSTNEMYLQ